MKDDAPWHRRLSNALPRWVHRLFLRFEAAVERQVRALAAAQPTGARVLDAGAGECRFARWFEHCRYVGVDLAVGDRLWNYGRLDARADLARLPFRDGCFQAALNIVVLEHTRDPLAVLSELHRVLAPGGELLLVAPQEWAMHQVPHDYFRFTRHGLELLLGRAGFTTPRLAPVVGFFTLFGRRCLEAALFLQGGWRWLLFPFVAVVLLPAGLLLPFADGLDSTRATTLGYVCHARKSTRC
jgi:SAM-dependent methyltransferase